jgi:UDP-N-acetylglucosamine--dolichyl-phosphate N-acetylglucosaminephosphotransferase
MRLTIFHLAAILSSLLVVVGSQLFGAVLPPFMIYIGIFVLGLCVSGLFLDKLIPRLESIKMIGQDENKPGKPEVAEMGGIAIVAGFSASALLAISLFIILPKFSLILLLAAVITIQTIGFIGIADDLFNLPQWFKALIPLAAAIPLVVVNAAGSTAITIPFIGIVDFGIVYMLVLVPVAIAVCSNLTNMLAGFNGMEAGMGAIMFLTLSILAWNHGMTEMLVISLAMLGSLAGFLMFNWFPAKVFPGDVGTLSIGVALATAVIIGNFESAGVILMIPYILDFFVKAVNRFPHTHQDIKGDKLFPKDGKVKGLVHIVMKAFGGISERNLVLFFIGAEAVCALLALGLYFRF